MSKKRDYAHVKAQKKGKERDLYTCQICGSTDHTEGHHLFCWISFRMRLSSNSVISDC